MADLYPQAYKDSVNEQISVESTSDKTSFPASNSLAPPQSASDLYPQAYKDSVNEQSDSLAQMNKNFSDLNALEEEERKDRLSRPLDPILLGKQHKLQTELLSKQDVSLPNVSATILEAKEAIAEKSSGWGETLSNLGENLLHKAVDVWNTPIVDVYDAAKEKLGLGLDPSSMAAEEKERSRRLGDIYNHDASAETQKRQVESELLSQTKLVN